MKKYLLIAAAALLVAVTANSQDVFKQQGGEKNFEALFTPLGDTPIGISGIKYRSFTSASNAWRATVSFGLNTTTSYSEMGDEELESSLSEFDFNIAPGYEWHFAGTDRLSPYCGAEIGIGLGSVSSVTETFNGPEDIVELETSASFFEAGAGVFTGFDFYIADNLYLGAEINFGVTIVSQGDTTTEFIDEEGNIDEMTTPGSSNFSIGEDVVGAIRVGFLFNK